MTVTVTMTNVRSVRLPWCGINASHLPNSSCALRRNQRSAKHHDEPVHSSNRRRVPTRSGFVCLRSRNPTGTRVLYSAGCAATMVLKQWMDFFVSPLITGSSSVSSATKTPPQCKTSSEISNSWGYRVLNTSKKTKSNFSASGEAPGTHPHESGR